MKNNALMKNSTLCKGACLWQLFKLKMILALGTIAVLVSCSTESFDDDSIQKDKFEIKKIAPEPVTFQVCEPTHFNVFVPIETIAENDYSAFYGLGSFTFAGDALQDTFMLPNPSTISLENDDILVLFSENTPPGWDDATSGITPFEFKYNDIPQRDIFDNLIWNWIYSEDGGTLSGTNLTDVYLSAVDKIQKEIFENPNYTAVNKIKIDISVEFNGAVTLRFFVWFK